MHMATRPAWSGHLKLSLVTCPVALYKATEAAKRGVSFNYINPKTNDRIAMKPSDASTGEEVARSDLVKGYQVDKGLYVTVTEEEIRSVKLESNGAIQIERFVAEAEIDRLYWDAPYYLVPDGALAFEPYAVIREAMREGGQVALARVVMNGRERQFALEVRGKGIVGHAIRTHHEVRPVEDYFSAIPEVTPDKNMVAIAKQILKQHEGPFDPRQFVDRYQAAVLALVERKKKEQGLTRQGHGGSRPQEAEIIDLMEMLKRSLVGDVAAKGGERRKRAAPAAKAAPTPQKARRKAG
jgi:DNA end-binding protein Ku